MEHDAAERHVAFRGLDRRPGAVVVERHGLVRRRVAQGERRVLLHEEERWHAGEVEPTHRERNSAVVDVKSPHLEETHRDRGRQGTGSAARTAVRIVHSSGTVDEDLTTSDGCSAADDGDCVGDRKRVDVDRCRERVAGPGIDHEAWGERDRVRSRVGIRLLQCLLKGAGPSTHVGAGDGVGRRPGRTRCHAHREPHGR